MLRAAVAEIVGAVTFVKGGASHTQAGLLGEPSQEKGVEVIFEGHVGIEVADNVVFELLDSFPARVETKYFPAKMTIFALRHSQQLDPVISSRIVAHDVIRAV